MFKGNNKFSKLHKFEKYFYEIVKIMWFDSCKEKFFNLKKKMRSIN